MEKRELVIRIVGLILLIACVLSSHYSHADTLGLNNQPIFYSMVNQNPVYHDAAFKAQEAFLVQTGVTPMTDRIAGYVTSSAQNKATTIINNETPLNAGTLYLVGGAAYTVLVKKQINQHFRDPIFRSITHTIHVDMGSASTGISIPLPF
jgi:hypothetical protein